MALLHTDRALTLPARSEEKRRSISAFPCRMAGLARYNAAAMAKKPPKQLALLDEDLCTGCEACVSVCPVDCIDTLPGPIHQNVNQSCTIDLPRCIGCTLCAQVCPWDVITMVPSDQMLREKRFADEFAK